MHKITIGSVVSFTSIQVEIEVGRNVWVEIPKSASLSDIALALRTLADEVDNAEMYS